MQTSTSVLLLEVWRHVLTPALTQLEVSSVLVILASLSTAQGSTASVSVFVLFSVIGAIQMQYGQYS